MLKNYFFIFVNFALFFITINADCTFHLEGNHPLLVKNFGSRKVILNRNLISVQLSDAETILAYCSTSMTLRSRYSYYISDDTNEKKVILQCKGNNHISYKTPGSVDYLDVVRGEEIYVGCINQQDQQLYESRKMLPNCEKYLSYGIGITLPTDHEDFEKYPTYLRVPPPISANHKDLVTAAICYDLNALQLKYATYFAYRPKLDIISDDSDVVKPAIALDEKLGNFKTLFTFMSQTSFTSSLDTLKKSEPSLNIFEFDYLNLVQDKRLKNDLSNYSELLNIVWWRNLRLGNWKTFLDIFEERTKHVKYMVYTGTSGQLQIPTTESGYNKTRQLTIEADGMVVNVPKYIWSYLNAVHENVTESFVVIGDNSPFYEQNHTIAVCKDICNEIPWLQSSAFAKSRLLPTMGLMHCCRPEEVAQQLDYFPHAAILPKAPPSNETVTLTTTTTTTTMNPFDWQPN